MGDEPELYDREVVRSLVREVARDRLSGEFTTETVEWDDGDYRVAAFHTIDATYPFEAEARDEEQGLPFYRERISFSTTNDDSGYVYQEVVRRTCGETGAAVVYSTPVAWAGPMDPRTANDAHVLRDLELTQVSLVPAEDVVGFGGGVVRPGTLSVDGEVSDEELQRFRDRFEEGA